MKIHVRIISVFLAVLMCLSVVACANNQSESEDTVSATDNSNATSVEEVTTSSIPVAMANYNKDFAMLSYKDSSGAWYYADSLQGEILNDALYNMTLDMKDHLGLTAKFYYPSAIVTGNEVYDMLKPSFDAGDDRYQMCITHPYYSIATFITKNMLLDFNELDDVNLEREYWNIEQMKALEVGGKTCIGIGDICRYDVNILFVNKDMMTDLQRTVPYEAVRNHEWTMDMLLDMTKDVYKDLDGQGNKDNQDRYGFACMWDANGSAFQQGCGVYTLTKNEDTGLYDITIYNDRTVEVFEKVQKLCLDDSSYIWDYGSRDNSAINMKFSDGNILVTHEFLSNQYLNAQFKVGILPMPLYDTAQKEYAHVNWGNLVCLPNTANDPNMVGKAVEFMAYYSDTIVQPAYYETVLGARVADTQDDWDMIQMIYDSIVFDPGIAFNGGNGGLWYLTYTFCFQIKSKTLTSYCKKYTKQAQSELKKLFGE